MRIGHALLLSVLAGCAAHVPPGVPVKSYPEQIEEWHHNRMEGLQKPGHWLSLAGLFWLSPAGNTVGSDPGAAIQLPPSAPAKVGTIRLDGVSATLALDPGVSVKIGERIASGSVPLVSDSDPKLDPTKVTMGPVTLWVIERGGRLGIRVTDDDAPARRNFGGIDTFPIDPKWRVEARLEPADSARTISLPTVIDGVFEEEQVAGTAVFTLEGKEYRLDPVIEKGETDLFFIFRDQTAGHETYGAGRFLYASPPKDGKVVLDFNKAYNPPCALTPFATCPLPPPQNVLPVRIEAGEKKYGGHG